MAPSLCVRLSDVCRFFPPPHEHVVTGTDCCADSTIIERIVSEKIVRPVNFFRCVESHMKLDFNDPVTGCSVPLPKKANPADYYPNRTHLHLELMGIDDTVPIETTPAFGASSFTLVVIIIMCVLITVAVAFAVVLYMKRAKKNRKKQRFAEMGQHVPLENNFTIDGIDTMDEDVSFAEDTTADIQT